MASPAALAAAYLRLLVDLRDAAQAHDRAGAAYRNVRGFDTPIDHPHGPADGTLLLAWGDARSVLDEAWRRLEAFERTHSIPLILAAAEAMAGKEVGR